MKKRILLALVSVLLLSALLLSSCMPYVVQGPEPEPSDSTSDSTNGTEGGSQPSDTEPENTYALTPSVSAKEKTLVQQIVLDYMAAEPETPVSTFSSPLLSPYPELSSDERKKQQEADLQAERFDQPKSIILSYKVSGVLPKGISVEKVVLLLSEDSSFTSVRTVKGSHTGQKATVNNLKTGITYYYRFIETLTDGSTVTSETATFKVADTPRLIKVDGLGNVRDFGGYRSTLKTNAVTKQGMIYRGTELDGIGARSGNVAQWQDYFYITEDGIDTMKNVLGIKSDMDLRGAEHIDKTIRLLGEDANYLYFPLSSYTGAFNYSTARTTYGPAMKSFADPKNYPFYVHCTYGADRTGTIFFMLEALLGVEMEDLVREYELSGVFYPSMSREQKSAFCSFLTQFNNLSGTTTAEKAETWCKNIGLTDDEIASIRTLLLETRE